MWSVVRRRRRGLPVVVVACERGPSDVGACSAVNVDECARCRREAPEWNGPESIAWEVLLGDDGKPMAIVCPDCLTLRELRRLKRGLPL